MKNAVQYLFNSLTKIAFLVLIVFLQNLTLKYFACTYNVKFLLLVFIGYVLIGILIGIEIFPLSRERINSIVIDWNRLIFYNIPLLITFILSYVYGITFRFFVTMKEPFEIVLLIMIGYAIARSLQKKNKIS